MANTATLLVAISARGAISGAKKYVSAVKLMRAQTKKTGGALAALKSTAASLLVTLGAYVGLRSSIQTIAEFGETMAMLEGVTSATTAEMQLFEDTARRLGATTRFTASQAAEGLLNLSRAGFTVAESNEAIAATLDLATAAVIDLGEASEITATTMRQFGLEASDATHIADVLVNTANSTNSTIQTLAQALSFAGTSAKTAGVSLEETAALLGVLHDAGIKSSRAGMALRQSMIRLVNPTDDAVKSLKEMGLSLDEVNPTKVGATEAFRKLGEAQMNLGQAAQIFGSRQATAALVMADATQKALQLTKANELVEGTARKNAALIEGTLKGAWLELLSTLQEVILMAGESGLTGALKDLIGFASALVKELAGIDQAAGKVTPAVAGVAEALRRVWKIGKILVALSIPVMLGSLATTASLAAVKISLMAKAIIMANLGLLQMAASLVGMIVPALWTIGVAAAKAAAVLTATLLPALAVLAAAYLGFKFGEWLEQFTPVQKGMQDLIKGIAKGFQWLKKTSKVIWAGMKSLVVTYFINPVLKVFDLLMDGVFKAINFMVKKARDLIRGLPGMGDIEKQLNRMVALTASGFTGAQPVADTFEKDVKGIEAAYDTAVARIEQTHRIAIGKIEQAAQKPKKTFKELVQDDMKKMVDMMGMFSGESEESTRQIEELQVQLNQAKANAEGLNSESADQVSIWTTAKNKVMEWGQTAMNWLNRVGDAQEDNTKKAERFKVTMEDIGGAATASLVDLAMGAKTFEDAILDATDAIIKMALQMAIMSAFSTPGVGGNPAAPVTGAKGLVAMAAGGVVNGPTGALIGERGPEAVIPLSRDERGNLGIATGAGGRGDANITFNIVSPDKRGVEDSLLRNPKLIQQMNQTYRQGYAIG